MARLDTVTDKTMRQLAAADSRRAVQPGNGKWTVTAQVALREIMLKSKRSPVRTWVTLDAQARYYREHPSVVDFEARGAGAAR